VSKNRRVPQPGPSKCIWGRTEGARSGGVLHHLPGYISRPMTTPAPPAPILRPSACPLPRHAPPNPAHPHRGPRQLASFGCVEKSGVSKNRRLSQPGRQPARSRAPRRRPSGLADRLPPVPPPPRLEDGGHAPRPPARGEKAPTRYHRRASRLARGVTSGDLPAHSPAAPGSPPQITPQPDAAGPVASRLTTYSPTPFGRGFCQHAFKCPKKVSWGGPQLWKWSVQDFSFSHTKWATPLVPEWPVRGLGSKLANWRIWGGRKVPPTGEW
jgi:hypothetical protein